MAALIVSIFALVVIILLEAGFWMAITLARWSPILLGGTLVGWLAARHGAGHLESLGLGVLAYLVCRWARAYVFDRA
jgi:hypothetical protein